MLCLEGPCILTATVHLYLDYLCAAMLLDQVL